MAQEGTIEFSGSREGLKIVLRCKDNSRGIPLEMQQTIFEPFTRVDPVSQKTSKAPMVLSAIDFCKIAVGHNR